MKKVFQIKTIHCVGALVCIILAIYVVDCFTPKASIKSIQETSLLEIENQSFKSKTGHGVSYVLFYKDRSEKCTEMAYNLEQLSQKESESHFYCMNVAKEKNHILTSQISGVPYTIIFKDGRPIEKVLGIVPISNLQMIHERINKKD